MSGNRRQLKRLYWRLTVLATLGCVGLGLALDRVFIWSCYFPNGWSDWLIVCLALVVIVWVGPIALLWSIQFPRRVHAIWIGIVLGVMSGSTMWLHLAITQGTAKK
jgi:hypothetical protein